MREDNNEMDSFTKGLLGVLSGIGIFLFIFVIVFEISESKIRNIISFKKSSNVYCPSQYKLVKSDGVFTSDHSIAVSSKKVKVVDVVDGYIYTSTGEAFRQSECHIKESR